MFGIGQSRLYWGLLPSILQAIEYSLTTNFVLLDASWVSPQSLYSLDVHSQR